MPSLNEIWALIAVDPAGLLVIGAALLVALAVGRLVAGGLAELPVTSSAERWLVWILAGCVAVSWTGTILAALALFRWWIVLTALAALVVIALSARRVSRSTGVAVGPLPCQTPKLAVWSIVAFLALAVWLFARPAESYFLVDDSAVYTIGGIVLARDGALLAHSASFWPVNADFARSFHVHNPPGTISRFYGPFYQYFLSGSSLEIGFLPLPKVWSALAVWVLGSARATWGTPLFGVLGLASLYGFMRRSVGWQAALLATVLLGISLPQVWLARYPISEVYAQATLLGGLYLVVLARANQANAALSRRLAFWSATCLGLWTVTRLESVVLLPLLAGLLILVWGRTAWQARGYARTWLAVLALCAAVGLVISVATSRVYLFDQSLRILSPRTAGLAVCAVLLLVAGSSLAWILRRHHARFLQAWDQWAGRWVLLATTVIWLASGLLSLLAVWRGQFVDSVPGWLAFYLSPLGVALGASGILWLLWQQHRSLCDRPELVAVLAIAGFFLVVYAVNPFVARWQPWAIRRLVPLILPVFALGSGALLTSGLGHALKHTGGAGRAWIGIFAAGCLLGQLFLEARVTLPLLFHRELRGYAAQLHAIAGRLPADAVLLFDNGLTAQGLPQAFELVFGRPALALQRTPSGGDEAALDVLIEKALSEKRPVYFVATDGNLAWWPEKWHFTSRGLQSIDTVVLRPPYGRAPGAEDVVARAFTMDLYEIQPRTTGQPAATLTVAADTGSYPFLRSGFYSWDHGADGKTARWTDGDATVALPWPSADPNQNIDFCLQMDIAGGRPVTEPPARLTIEAEGVTVFNDELSMDFAAREIRIPARQIRNLHLDELELRLVSTTWNAASAGDNRVLGVFFYGLRLLPLAACATDG